MGGFSEFASRWTGFWNKHDPDNVFSYDTFKMVTIRDRYLGFLHHGLQLGIIIYIIVYVIFVQKQFLKLEQAIGLVRIAAVNDPLQRTLQDIGLTEYCDMPATNTGKPMCIFPPLDQIAVGTGSSLFITTYMERTSYTATCDPNLASCEPTASPTEKFVIGNLQHLNISIDHSVQVNFEGKAPLGYLQTLKDPNADESEWNKCTKCPVNRFESLSADNVPLSSFLVASDLNLNETANDYLIGTPDYKEPLARRLFGSVILLSIKYDNSEHYFRGNPPILYYYKPRLIRDVDDYYEESIFTAYPYNRTVINRRGIRVVGVISGELGHFTFQTLLIQLTTSLALMKVATTVVDLIAINLLPAKRLYKKAKYERTEDFSDLKDKSSKLKHEKEEMELEEKGGRRVVSEADSRADITSSG